LRSGRSLQKSAGRARDHFARWPERRARSRAAWRRRFDDASSDGRTGTARRVKRFIESSRPFSASASATRRCSRRARNLIAARPGWNFSRKVVASPNSPASRFRKSAGTRSRSPSRLPLFHGIPSAVTSISCTAFSRSARSAIVATRTITRTFASAVWKDHVLPRNFIRKKSQKSD